MMNKYFEELCYLPDEDLDVVELEYGNGNFAMYLLRPKKEKFKEFVENLSSAELTGILSKMEKHDLKLSMPKFKVDYSSSMLKNIENLGLDKIKDPGFNTIFEGRMCNVTGILHSAVINCDESGTEAAAATGIAMSCSVRYPEEIVFDSPFVFLVMEKSTMTVLFIGQATKL